MGVTQKNFYYLLFITESKYLCKLWEFILVTGIDQIQLEKYDGKLVHNDIERVLRINIIERPCIFSE